MQNRNDQSSKDNNARLCQSKAQKTVVFPYNSEKRYYSSKINTQKVTSERKNKADIVQTAVALKS